MNSQLMELIIMLLKVALREDKSTAGLHDAEDNRLGCRLPLPAGGVGDPGCRIPTPSPTGTVTLKAIDGVIGWQ